MEYVWYTTPKIDLDMDGTKIFKQILMKFLTKLQSYILDYVPLTNNYEQANEHEIGVFATLCKKIKVNVS